MSRSVEEYVDLVAERADVMTVLEDGPLEPREVEARTDASRATVNRALRSLADAGLVERTEGSYGLTATGRVALAHHRRYRREWADIVDARELLAPLPAETALDVDVLAGGTVHLAPEETPYRPVERVHGLVREAEAYRAVLPALDDPRHVRLLYEHVVTDDRAASLVVPESLRASLADQFPRRLAAMADAGGFELLVGEPPPFGVVICEADGERSVAVVVFGDGGGVHGVLENDADRAVRWAEARFAAARDDGQDATDSLRQTADGGVVDAGVGAGGGLDWPGVLVSLEREGFVRLSDSFFAEREVAAPTTAWRAGLDLAEVHTGYAVERTVAPDTIAGVDDDGSELRAEAVADGQCLADLLVGRLREGQDCALVGPPGSGKSTTCKRVATEWYDAGHGAVFYRAGGRGRPFRSVDDLVATVERAEGHALVVVEDAVRPDTDAVFEVVARLADREDASVLLDAREREWRDPPGDGDAPGRFQGAVVGMPPLADDYERLVEHFERTTGAAVDVPAERLREEVRSDNRAGGERDVGELLLVLHRLTAYADPMAEGPTSLEEAVEDLREELAALGDGARTVGLLANGLNAAGLPVSRPVLRAAVTASPDRTGSVADEAAVDAALDQLEGTVILEDTGETPRTVHESWSVAYLETALDASDDVAALFGRGCSALLELADDPPVDAAGEPGDAEHPTGRIVDAPADWADEVLRRLYALGRERPKLAPLFGDGDDPSVAVPDACSSVTRRDCRRWLGEMYLGAGDYDRAERVYEGLPAEGELGRERLLGRCEAARERGDFETAATRASRGVERAREADDRRREAAFLKHQGVVAMRRGEYDAARDHLRESRRQYDALEDRRGVSDCLGNLAVVAYRQDDLAAARSLYEEALELKRELGDRSGMASLHNNLGLVAWNEGDHETAREQYARSLDLNRAVGDRTGEASAQHNLGILADETGDPEAAREHYERSLELKRAVGDRHGAGETLINLGDLARSAGDYDAAEEHLREALAIQRDIGADGSRTTTLLQLGDLHRERGDHAAAASLLSEGRQLAEDVGTPKRRAQIRDRLGRLARRRGDYASAREHHRTALEGFAEVGYGLGEAEARYGLAWAALFGGDLAAAADHAGAAVAAAQDVDAPQWQVPARVVAARVAVRRARTDDAREHLAAAERHLEELGLPDSRLGADLDLARGAVARVVGDLATAEAAATDALTAYRDAELAPFVADARLELARIASAREDRQPAAEHAEAALTTARELDAPRCEVDALLVLGWCDRRREDLAAAADRSAAAHELAAETGYVRGAVRSLVGRGRVDTARGDDQAARERLSRAHGWAAGTDRRLLAAAATIEAAAVTAALDGENTSRDAVDDAVETLVDADAAGVAAAPLRRLVDRHHRWGDRDRAAGLSQLALELVAGTDLSSREQFREFAGDT